MAQSEREVLVQRRISEKLCQARQASGATQAMLGAACGCTFQQIQKYEQARNRISAAKLVVAADFLGVPVGYFFDPADEHATPDLSKRHLQLIRALLAIEAQSKAEFQAYYDLAMARAAFG